jgi:oxygen-independent coproporphyrinogen-3 oxidase
MLLANSNALNVVRFATADSLERFDAGSPLTRADVTMHEALEEEFFLGLRLNRGVDLQRLSKQYGEAMQRLMPQVQVLIAEHFLVEAHGSISLTSKGRLLSNEVFGQFINFEDVILSEAKDLAV